MDFVRRFTVPAVGFLFGVGLQVSGIQAPVLTGVLWLAAAIWAALALVTWPAFQRLVPVTIERDPTSFAIRFRLPTVRRKRRLRRETLALVQDIHAHLKSRPSPMIESLSESQATFRAMQAAKDEADKQAIWDQSTLRISEQYDRERQEMAELFGGRVRYVIGEFIRLGRLDSSESRHLEWECSSVHWIATAAAKLEALALGL